MTWLARRALVAENRAPAAESTWTATRTATRSPVVTVVDETPEAHVLCSSFHISYFRLEVDEDRGSLVARTSTARTFDKLPADVLAALVTDQSDRIPEKIMALAPNDPLRAIQRYLGALQFKC